MNIPDQIDEIAETRDWQPTRYSGDLGGKSIEDDYERGKARWYLPWLLIGLSALLYAVARGMGL